LTVTVREQGHGKEMVIDVARTLRFKGVIIQLSITMRRAEEGREKDERWREKKEWLLYAHTH
jgi:hypothetical protein